MKRHTTPSLKKGERSYALFREILKETGKVALAKIAFKEREHIAIVRDYHGTLMVHTLLYADEITGMEALNIPGKVDLDKKELALAAELVDRFIGKINIEAYRDEFRASLMEVIRAKIAGREVVVIPGKEAEKVVDLMEALKRSLEKSKKKRAG